jgi:hypothetical protein
MYKNRFVMTPKAFPGQQLVRKTAKPGFIFVLFSPGAAFRR